MKNLYLGKIFIAFIVLMVIYSVSKGFLYQIRNYNITPPSDYFLLWDVPKVLSIRPVANIYSDKGLNEIRTELINISTSQAVSTNQQLLTAKAIDHESLRPVGSPLLFTFIGLLSTGNFDTDLLNYSLITLTCYLTSIVIFCILLKLPPLLTFVSILYFTSCYDPYLSDIFVLNINQIQLLIITLIIYSFSKNLHFACGLVLGFALMLKPNVLDVYVLICAGYIIRYKYNQFLKMNIGLIISIAVSFTISSIYFGNYYIWLDFFKSIPSTLRIKMQFFEGGNYGLVSLINYLTGFDFAIFVKLILLIPVGYMFFLSRIRKEVLYVSDDNIEVRSLNSGISQYGVELTENVNDAFILVGAGCLLMSLSSPLVWLHYYILQIPVMLYLLKLLSNNRFRLYAKVACIFVVMAVNSFFMKYLDSNVISSVALNVCALLMLIVLYKVLLGTLNRKVCFT